MMIFWIETDDVSGSGIDFHLYRRWYWINTRVCTWRICLRLCLSLLVRHNQISLFQQAFVGLFVHRTHDIASPQTCLGL